MGNCVFKGFTLEVEETIKVVTANGGIMELHAPITAACITNEFPGHAIYSHHHHLLSQPLLHNEELHAGHLYYLLPLNTNADAATTTTSASSYRMSFENNHQRAAKRSAAEVFPRYNGSGVWKVKLVISPEELGEILRQEARTEELIESVRTVAKCGNSYGVSSNATSSVANSDQWSVSSSWKGSS